MDIRIGHGYDLHRLEPLGTPGSTPQSGAQPVRPMVLGGVTLDSPVGPVGHSDGDALLHAVTDAILGALALPDIGQLFPDSDPRWAGADSMLFLKEAVSRARRAGYRITSVDTTVICERPKIGPHKDEIRASIARGLGIDATRVNVKGKTHERVDAVGEGRAIEVHAVAVLIAG